MPERRYPISDNTQYRRRVLLGGYAVRDDTGSQKKDDRAARRAQNYVELGDAAIQMGYVSRKSATRALEANLFELAVYVLHLPPDYKHRRYVKKRALEKLVADPPPRMLKRLIKKGLAGSSS